MFSIDFKERVLSFSTRAAPHLVALVVERLARGRPIEFADALIAAICRLQWRGTRNT
jgi:predicted nucleic acid-binding protein